MADETSKKSESQKPEPSLKTPAKKSNTKLYIILGSVAFLLVIVPIILYFVAFNFVKDKIVGNTNNSAGISGLVNKATDGKVNVDTKNGEVTIKGDNGDEISNKKTLPDGFPITVKVYSPGTIVGSYKSTTDGKTNWTVSLETTDSAAKVNESIKNTFTSWTLNGDYSAGDNKVVSYEDTTNKLVITVGAPTNSGDKTTVLYSVTEK